ncbi:RhuM family protein, partial [Nautilia sp.]
MSDIVIYKDGEIELKSRFDGENIWLRQDEIAKLFEKDRTVITRHINNILKDKEVDEKSNVQKMHFANSDKPVKLYSLDIILAVGYRTNSSKATKFRQWATKILKKYIIKGYALNQKRIKEKFEEFEKEINLLTQA